MDAFTGQVLSAVVAIGGGVAAMMALRDRLFAPITQRMDKMDAKQDAIGEKQISLEIRLSALEGKTSAFFDKVDELRDEVRGLQKCLPN